MRIVTACMSIGEMIAEFGIICLTENLMGGLNYEKQKNLFNIYNYNDIYNHIFTHYCFKCNFKS